MPLRRSRFDGDADVRELVDNFHRIHAEVFAIEDPRSEIELVGWRASAHCRLREPSLNFDQRAGASQPKRTHRRVWFDGAGRVEATVVRLESLAEGERLLGPAIVESPFTTVVIDPGALAERTSLGSLSILPSGDEPPKGGLTDGRSLTIDGTRMAVLSNRLDGVVRGMTNTLFRTGRSGILNTARDFSCAILDRRAASSSRSPKRFRSTSSRPDIQTRALRGAPSRPPAR